MDNSKELKNEEMRKRNATAEDTNNTFEENSTGEDKKEESEQDSAAKDKDGSNSSFWKFIRQLLVCSTVWNSFFVNGLCIAATSVIIPQLKKEAKDDISYDLESLLSSTINFSTCLSIILLAILARQYGRKTCFAIAIIVAILSFVLLYNSTNVAQIFISVSLQGFFCAAQMTVSLLIITECTSPKFRGLIVSIKFFFNNFGLVTAKIVGFFFHWKNIGLVGMLSISYSFVTMFILPESPLWLASQGRYEDCKSSHQWLNGDNSKSKKKLKALINSQKAEIVQRKKLRDLYVKILTREFYKPTLSLAFVGVLGACTCKIVCAVYTVHLIKKITHSSFIADFFIAVLDGVSILSMFFGWILLKFMKRKIVFVFTTSVSAVFVIVLCLYLYLIHSSIMVESTIISLILLVFISTSVPCGPLLMSSTVFEELIPKKLQNIAACFVAMTGKLLMAIILKTAPYLFWAFNMYGAFLFLGIVSILCSASLCWYLPDSPDEIIQEIDNLKIENSELVLVSKSAPKFRKNFTNMLIASDVYSVVQIPDLVL